MTEGRYYWQKSSCTITLEGQALNDGPEVGLPLAAGVGAAIGFRQQRKAGER
jgi:hypothetical protein